VTQRGQSLVEFALSSVVLLLLVGGLVDIGRAIYVGEALSNAAREGARHGVWFDPSTRTHPYLYDAEIKSVVDAELNAIGIPGSTLKNASGTTCPSPSDGNTAGTDFTSPALNQSQNDLNVIVLYAYGPLTPLITAQFGIFRLAANTHMTVQGNG
jgi:Flp pilus assembly protein TadG